MTQQIKQYSYIAKEEVPITTFNLLNVTTSKEDDAISKEEIERRIRIQQTNLNDPFNFRK